MQETVPRVIIQNRAWKDAEIIKNEILLFGGILGALGFTRRPKGAPSIVILRHVGATWSILFAILAPTGFRRGPQSQPL